MYPNGENMIVVPNHNKNEDYDENPSLAPLKDEHLLYKKSCKEKLFLQIQSINIVYHKEKTMIFVPITKGVKIIMSIQVCLILRINYNNKENGEKKSFSCKSIAPI